jgi:anti-sigma regulatory factor (Ser/Thr protein kinase)
MTERDRAIAWTRQHRPELIFLMPDAPQVVANLCESFKLDPATNVIPILAVSVAPEDLPVIAGLQISCNHRLTVPLTLDQLRQAVEEVQAWRSQLQKQRISSELCFQLPSAIPSLERLTQALESLFIRAGFSFDQVKRLKIAVRELGINAIEWGHRKEIDKIITVNYRVYEDRMTLTIRDTGSGFDPGQIPHAARPGDPVGHLETREGMGLREGGFGILLAQGLADELRYNDLGNEVCLVKYLPASLMAGETG